VEHSTLVDHSILEFEGDPRLSRCAAWPNAPVVIKPGNRRESVETLRRLLRSELVANAVAVAPSSPAAAGCMSTRAGPRAFEKPTDDVAGL
jgi:hypothetical protein